MNLVHSWFFKEEKVKDVWIINPVACPRKLSKYLTFLRGWWETQAHGPARTAGMVNTETINHFPDIKCTFKLWKWSDKKHFASSKIIMKLVWTCYRERRGYLGSEIASQNTNSLHFSAVQTEDRLRVRCPQIRTGRKLPCKLQSGRPFTHFYSFFWLWSTGLYSCLTTWVTHFPRLPKP